MRGSEQIETGSDTSLRGVQEPELQHREEQDEHDGQARNEEVLQEVQKAHDA
jgi:hypothetical protein